MLDGLTRKRKVFLAYRLLFLKDGKLKPEAQTVLEDLCDNAKFFKDAPPREILPEVEGGRQMVRHILKRLKHSDKFLSGQIQRQLEDNEHE